MQETSTYTQFPDLLVLTDGLNSILNFNDARYGKVTILDREQMKEGSFPKELVTCRLEDGKKLQLFCKYTGGYSHASHGHRAGVPYEARIYQGVLAPLSISKPTFYGTHTGATKDDVWVVLEYLPDTLRLNQPDDPDAAMVLAARWLGNFHSLVERRLPSSSIVSSYDSEYYRGWSRRALEFTRDAGLHFGWLDSLCAKYEEFGPVVLGSCSTVIHGEFYPRNILFRDGEIYPVDWESAAIAAGEIDLVTMTDCWDDDVTERCALIYQQARWPKGVPADFENRITWARLYLQLRWLGDCGRAEWWCASCQRLANRPRQNDWTLDQDSLWRFEQLKFAGKQLGLI